MQTAKKPAYTESVHIILKAVKYKGKRNEMEEKDEELYALWRKKQHQERKL